MKKLGILAFLWLIAFAKANADQTGTSEEESTEKSNGFKSSSSSRSSSQSLLQQSSFEDQESKFQEQQSSSLEQSSLQEQDSSFQEEQLLSKEQKSMHQEQKSSFHEEQSSLIEEKQQQLSNEEQQSSLKEQQSSLKVQQSSFQEQQSSFQKQQSSFQEQQSSFQEQQSLLNEQKSTVEEQESLLKEQKSTLREHSLLKEQKSTNQEQQSLLEDKKSTDQEQQSVLEEQKSTVHQQQSLLEEQKSTKQEQQSLLEEKKSTEQQQESSLKEQKPTAQEQKSLLEEQKSTDQEQQTLFQDQKLSSKEQQLLLHKQKSSLKSQHSLTFEKHQYNKERSLSKKQESTVSVKQEQFKQEKQVKQKHQNNIREKGYSSVQQNENYHSSTKKSRQESEHKTQQAGQPESVWIGNTPDTNAYTKIIDVNKNISKSVVNKQEEDRTTNVVKETNTKQAGQPESVWIDNAPDSNVYSEIIDVNKKATSSENTSKSVVNKQEEDRTTNVVKKTNTKQAGQPESVWIDNAPDSNVYAEIIDVNKKATSSKNTSQSAINKQEDDRTTNVVKKTNTKQAGQPESVWIDNAPDSNVYAEIIDVNKKATSSENTSKSVVNKQEEDRTTNVVKKTNTKQAGQPESVWIDNAPDSNVYAEIIDVNKKATSSKNTSKSAINKQEEDRTTNVVKKTNTKQAGQPESVWIDNAPDSNVYAEIIDVNKKATSSENTSKSVVNKQEEDRTTNVVKKTNTKQAGQPESVWIDNAPDSNVYAEIIDVNKKATSSKNTSKSAINKQEEHRTTNVVKKTNTKQAGQPESVWIDNAPDSNVYAEIIDVNKKATSSENTSKSVVNKQEEDRTTNIVKKTNTKQAGQPESVWIDNAPDSNVYAEIIDVNKKATSSENTSKSVVNKQEEDRTTNVVKKTNTKQAGQPESVWIDNAPDSNVYAEIIDVNKKATSSKNTSKSAINKQEEHRTTNVVKKTNTKQAGQPESVWIDNAPDSNVYAEIIDVNKKATSSENTSKSVVNKQEEDRTTNIVKKTNTKQAGQPESVWIDNEPDSNVHAKIIDVNKKATSSKNTSKSAINKQEEDRTTNVVKKTNTKQAGQPESVWIGNTPDTNVYTKIIDVNKKATSSENTSKSVVNKQEDDRTTNVVKKTNTKQAGQPESVWIDNAPDSKVYTEIIEIDKKAISSKSTATETSNSKSSSAAQVTVKNSQAKYQNKPIRPYPPRLTLRPKLPVKSGSKQPTQPVPVKQYRPRYNLPPKKGNKKPIQPKLDQPKYNQVPRPGTKQSTPPGYNPSNEPEYNKKYQPESVWIGKTPDPKEYKIYYANKKNSKHEERDDEYYRESSKYDISTTETNKVVRGIRMELNLNTVFLDYGKNSDCFCSCSTDKSPFFVSIPRNKVKSYLNEML